MATNKHKEELFQKIKELMHCAGACEESCPGYKKCSTSDMYEFFTSYKNAMKKLFIDKAIDLIKEHNDSLGENQ